MNPQEMLRRFFRIIGKMSECFSQVCYKALFDILL